jgi:NADH-quinone oxidoreductase subunit G
MPSLNQQEGTITTVDKRVVPINVAQPYNGYVLNDIANELGLNATYTIDYTKELPTQNGFEAIEFDSLDNRLDGFGRDVRGYELKSQKVSLSRSFEEVAELEAYDGAIVYNTNPTDQFNANTNASPLLKDEAYLCGSKAFANAAKLKDGDTLSFKVGEVVCERVFKIDDTLKGTIALNPTFDLGLEISNIKNYRFERLSIIRNT